jgi:hypothetical protein
MSTQDPFWNPDTYRMWVRSRYGEGSVVRFEAAVEDSLRIAKLLALETQAEFPSYREIYKQALKASDRVMLRYATIDPRDATLLQRLRPIQLEEIARYYRDRTGQWKSPLRVAVLYAGAMHEDYKGRVKEPDEAALKAYFDKNSLSFKEGDKIPEFAAVRDKVYRKWLRSELEQDLYNIGWEFRIAVDSALAPLRDSKGELTTAQMLQVFEEKRAEFEKRGTPFRIGTTLPFARSEAEETKKREGIGSDSKVETFALTDAKLGTLHRSVDKTETGCFIYAVFKRVEPKEVPLSREIEEMIRGRLTQEQIDRLAEHEAKRIATLLQAQGAEAVEKQTRITFLETKYFSANPDSARDLDARIMGVADEEVAERLPQTLSKLPEIGSATHLSFSRGRNPARHYVVAQLADRYRAPVPEIGDKVKEIRGQEISLGRLHKKEAFRKVTLERSGFDALIKPAATESAPPGP